MFMLSALNSCAHGTKTLHKRQAGVMFANGLAVLNNERFLEKSDALLLHTCLLFAINTQQGTGHNDVCCSWLGLFTTTWRQRHWPRPWGFQTADNWAAARHDLHATYALGYALGYVCVLQHKFCDRRAQQPGAVGAVPLIVVNVLLVFIKLIFG